MARNTLKQPQVAGANRIGECIRAKLYVGLPTSSENIDEFERIVRYKALQLMRKRRFERMDLEDFEQELRLVLIQKLRRFDDSRAKRSTFASRIIESKGASLVRAAKAKKRGCRRTHSLNNPVGDETGNPTELANTLDEARGRRHTGGRQRTAAQITQLRLDIAAVNASLSHELKELAALLSHVSLFAAAQVLGISRRQASVRLTALRAAYAERGLNP